MSKLVDPQRMATNPMPRRAVVLKKKHIVKSPPSPADQVMEVKKASNRTRYLASMA